MKSLKLIVGSTLLGAPVRAERGKLQIYPAKAGPATGN
jgi:hypothetical protein